MTIKSIIPKDELKTYNKFCYNSKNKKRTVENINIQIPTSEILISYALIYTKLNNEGKELAQKQLKLIGENYDKLVKFNNDL